MVKFKEIEGSYRQIMGHLKVPGSDLTYADVFCALNTKLENQRVIRTDFERQNFVGWGDKTRALLQKTWEADDVSLTYSQGNVTGAVISKLILDSYIVPKVMPDLALSLSYSLSFAYFDDSHPAISCGFSLSYLDSDPSIWSAAIIKNTTASPDDRQVFSLSHECLINTGVATTFNLKKLLNQLGSRSIQTLLNSIIFADGRVNVEEIKRLQVRVNESDEENGKNIDNHEAKHPLFLKKLDVIQSDFRRMQKCHGTQQFLDYSDKLAFDSFDDINFYETTQYKARLEEIDEVLLYAESFKAFQALLVQLNAQNKAGMPPSALYERSLAVIAVAQRISLSEPNSARTLHAVMQCCAKALVDPTDEANIKKIDELSKSVSGNKSTVSRGLGAALVLLGVALIIVALCSAVCFALLATQPGGLLVGGLIFLLGALLAVAAPIAICDGVDRYQKKGLARHLSLFQGSVDRTTPAVTTPAGSSSSTSSTTDDDSVHDDSGVHFESPSSLAS